MVQYSTKYSELEFGLKHKRYCDRHGINPHEANLEEIKKGMGEEMREKRKKRYEEHKDEIKEVIRKCKEKQRDKVLEQRRLYAQQTYLCECGCTVRRNNLSTHLKTQKHERWSAWVEQGLNPIEEEKRLEREAFLKQMHDLENGGWELQRERHRMNMEDHRAWEPARRRRKEREEATEEL